MKCWWHISASMGLLSFFPKLTSECWFPGWETLLWSFLFTLRSGAAVAIGISSCLLTCCRRNLAREKGFCVFSPLLQHSLDVSSCTVLPLSSSGAQRLKAARCTDSMSISVGFHGYPPWWIMQITAWRRCSSRKEGPHLVCKPLLNVGVFNSQAAFPKVQLWHYLYMNIKQQQKWRAPTHLFFSSASPLPPPPCSVKLYTLEHRQLPFLVCCCLGRDAGYQETATPSCWDNGRHGQLRMAHQELAWVLFIGVW